MAIAISCEEHKKGTKLLLQLTPQQLIIAPICLINSKEYFTNMAVIASFKNIVKYKLMPMMLMCVYRAYGEQIYLLDIYFRDMEIYLRMSSKARFGSKQDV